MGIGVEYEFESRHTKGRRRYKGTNGASSHIANEDEFGIAHAPFMALALNTLQPSLSE
jgi:hypothetical protein